ncbi:hypothetical protein J3R82DRAFT_10992 [Butyriboletus roseoflavus]|nr:hypothetical protein J3R82DRAFT_10992 [Butyriboletus roseoflavus]
MRRPPVIRTTVIDNLRRLSTSSMATSTEKQKFFLTHNKYAVVGASTDQAKWGTKILQWYIERDRDVTPVHPVSQMNDGLGSLLMPFSQTNTELEGRKTVKSVDELTSPTETALSIVTPAKVRRISGINHGLLTMRRVKITIKLLEQAKAQGIPAIWIQPGATDQDCVNYITNNAMADYVLWQGECLWRDGDGVLRIMAHERASL